MEAIVLAGGLGTRLRSIVNDIPKPMAPIRNKPFLEYILKYLKNNGILRVILSVGYKSDTIKNYFGNVYDGIDLIYSVEDAPLGTGGAIKKALHFVQSDDVFVINGDTFFNVNLRAMYAEFQQKNSDLMLSLKPMKKFDRYGCVETVNHRVVCFSEKGQRETGNINGGIYILKQNMLEKYKLEEAFSFETFICQRVLELIMFGFVSEGYFIDIGIPEDYLKAQDELEIQFEYNV